MWFSVVRFVCFGVLAPMLAKVLVRAEAMGRTASCVRRLVMLDTEAMVDCCLND